MPLASLQLSLILPRPYSTQKIKTVVGNSCEDSVQAVLVRTMASLCAPGLRGSEAKEQDGEGRSRHSVAMLLWAWARSLEGLWKDGVGG